MALTRRSVLMAGVTGSLMTGVAARAATPLGLKAAIIHDPLSGVALFGYDPVAFFLDGRALQGDRRHLAVHGNLVWHFRSPANRAGFVAAPDAYVPAFGGHDPTALAEGALAAGDPAIFLTTGSTLLFFRSDERREHFIADPMVDAKARREWPEIARRQIGQ
jgi:hypothetical protein